MLLGLSRSSSSLTLCARCARHLRCPRKAETTPKTFNGRTMSTATTAERMTTDDHFTTTPLNHDNAEAGLSASPSILKNVWTQMQESLKRQCILTRKTLPADYLLKLKPRSYPSQEIHPGGTYLTPSIINKSDPGRSYYLTLHREVLARLHEPGPQTGILSQHDIQIPRKLDEWIQAQLEERLLRELGLLVDSLKRATVRVKNVIPNTQAQGVITRQPDPADDLDQLLLLLPSTSTTTAEPTSNPSTIDLRSLSQSHRPRLFEHLNQLLLTDRKYLIRHAIASKSPLPKALIGVRNEGRLEGSMISLSSGSERGQLVLPVMVALLRLKLYSGQAWTHM